MYKQWAFVLAIVFTIIAGTAGCATTGQSNAQIRERTVTSKQVPVTGADGVVALVTTREVTVRDQVTGTTTTSHETVDMPAAIDAAGQVVGGLAKIAGSVAMPGLDWQQILGGLGALAGTALIGHRARQGEVRAKDGQIAERDARIDRLREDRDRQSAKVQEYALKMPPVV